MTTKMHLHTFGKLEGQKHFYPAFIPLYAG